MLAVAVGATAVGATECFAVLGGDVSSVQQDSVRIHASARITQKQNYAIHEFQSPSGVVIREYAAPSGKVFAIAWQGPSLPDMKQLLGTYFEEFQKAAQTQNRRGGHGPLIIHEQGLAVELGGHMRSFVGRAYLPQEIPPDVRNEELR